MSPKKADTAAPMPGALWVRKRPPSRNSGSLTREAIAAAAVVLLDRDNGSALSLRAVARELVVHPTSLYWHVATRDDLLDLALDAVFSELPDHGEPGPDWTADVRAFMHDLRSVLRRHPWSGALASSRPLLGPSALARSEFVFSALHRAGFRGSALTAAAAAVSNLAIGSVAAEAAWQHDTEHRARTAMQQHLQAHADRYPVQSAVIAAAGDGWAEHFGYAVDALVSGLNCQLEREPA